MRRSFALAAALCAAAPVPPAWCAPADSLAALWRYLGGCATLEGVTPGAVGSEVTVLFSLKRDGSLLGQPRITHSRLLGSEADQRAFVGAALGAVSRCLPAEITDGLGGAIAGRPLNLRLTSRKPERAL
ncbi:hypothetical protein [Methylobacterium sp. J-076]|uniref:hypothetical protein n=1 Tax=Methylobacterium sp. J-076 TaxID=2836655 RepID=UPI001FBAC56E|nr:hypothetical protein [Methylobacterium sp. J-076]MCJ2015441.1 hypothetical protein [Methylobacterium sp. J-076]